MEKIKSGSVRVYVGTVTMKMLGIGTLKNTNTFTHLI